MALNPVIAACARCRDLAEEWWRLGIADDKSKMRMLEFVFYGHLTDEHPMVHPTALEGCRGCQEAVTTAQFFLPDLAMHRPDGSYVDPARLHFCHHLLEQTAEVSVTGAGAPHLTSGHSFTAHLYHRADHGPTPGHRCSPDRRHSYEVTVELKAPVTLATEDQTMALRIAVSELERDLQYRELERLGTDDEFGVAVDNRFGLAQWVHATIAHRLADGMGSYLRVQVDAPAEGSSPGFFPADPK
ncbi:hypothetical protein [Streptomyces lunaelactis]|uniref:hypothetical protein n=1 Tax=Streptomyces lunaelactis TaxID=1535768 RepID=UPI0015849284|nr:hypothetical protein [Streptomyces lunaelactis]NUL24927.1 hypothetical protein [Streptomyces lunaelactis]